MRGVVGREPEADADQQATAESPLTPDEWRDAVLESDGGFV